MCRERARGLETECAAGLWVVDGTLKLSEFLTNLPPKKAALNLRRSIWAALCPLQGGGRAFSMIALSMTSTEHYFTDWGFITGCVFVSIGHYVQPCVRIESMCIAIVLECFFWLDVLD